MTGLTQKKTNEPNSIDCWAQKTAKKRITKYSLNSSSLIQAQIALGISALFGLLAVIGIVFLPDVTMALPLVRTLTMIVGLSTIVAIALLVNSSAKSKIYNLILAFSMP